MGALLIVFEMAFRGSKNAQKQLFFPFFHIFSKKYYKTNFNVPKILTHVCLSCLYDITKNLTQSTEINTPNC